MSKKNLTLSLDEDKIKELKIRAIEANMTLSDYLAGASDTREGIVAGVKEYKK